MQTLENQNVFVGFELIEKNLLTLEEAKQSSSYLRVLFQTLYSPNMSAQEEIQSSLPHFLAEFILMNAQKKGIPLTNIPQVQELLEETRRYIDSLPSAEVVISFLPKYKTLQRISEWFHTQYGTHILVGLRIDETIVAGARISYQGVFKDLSLDYWFRQSGERLVEQQMN